MCILMLNSQDSPVWPYRLKPILPWIRSKTCKQKSEGIGLQTYEWFNFFFTVIYSQAWVALWKSWKVPGSCPFWRHRGRLKWRGTISVINSNNNEKLLDQSVQAYPKLYLTRYQVTVIGLGEGKMCYCSDTIFDHIIFNSITAVRALTTNTVNIG